MKSIWKYPLKIEDYQEVRMPMGAKALTIQVQGGAPCLWAMLETEEKTTALYPVWMHGTGHPADEAAQLGRYVSTIQAQGGALIFHFFIGLGA